MCTTNAQQPDEYLFRQTELYELKLMRNSFVFKLANLDFEKMSNAGLSVAIKRMYAISFALESLKEIEDS